MNIPLHPTSAPQAPRTAGGREGPLRAGPPPDVGGYRSVATGLHPLPRSATREEIPYSPDPICS